MCENREVQREPLRGFGHVSDFQPVLWTGLRGPFWDHFSGRGTPALVLPTKATLLWPVCGVGGDASLRTSCKCKLLG